MDITDFENYRSLLQGIAYRMLGSVAEAQDIVQETYLKWADHDRSEIQNARSWLVTVCSRLSLDRLKSAQYRREEYIGPWLPEPLISTADSPLEQLHIDDSVSTALLFTLERLSPAERAAFLLHDIFEYSFEEIANILQKSPAACRKLASRARAQTKVDKPRFQASPETHQRLITSFFQAAKEGDFDSIKSLLADDVTFVSDGGGKALAARKIMVGPEIISKFFANTARQAEASGNSYESRVAWYNGAPGYLIYENGKLITAINLIVLENRIQSFYVHRNPDKLALFESN